MEVDMAEVTRKGEVAGLILAAGRSRRFGAPKALVEIGGRPSVRRVARAAIDGGLRPVVIVTRPELAAAVRVAVAGLDARVVAVAAGERADRGASLAAGLATLVGLEGLAALAVLEEVPSDGVLGGPGPSPASSPPAVAILVADAPFTPSELVAEVVETWRAGRGAIIRPRCGAGPAHPVLFDRSLLGALAAAALRGEGGRAVVSAYRDALVELPVDDASLVADFDTPAALSALLDARQRARR
jgi:CTP:molybdopterin cytidylyltransferase MocA